MVFRDFRETGPRFLKSHVSRILIVSEISKCTANLTKIIPFTPNVHEIGYGYLERFPKTNSKAIPPSNHYKSRQRDEPITIPRNYL